MSNHPYFTRLAAKRSATSNMARSLSVSNASHNSKMPYIDISRSEINVVSKNRTPSSTFSSSCTFLSCPSRHMNNPGHLNDFEVEPLAPLPMNSQDGRMDVCVADEESSYTIYFVPLLLIGAVFMSLGLYYANICMQEMKVIDKIRLINEMQLNQIEGLIKNIVGNGGNNIKSLGNSYKNQKRR